MSESSAKLRIIVDTNLIVSGTIIKRGNPYELLAAWRTETFTVLLSIAQHTELTEVLSREKFIRDYDLTTSEVTEVFGLIETSPRVEPSPTIPVHLRDSKDVHILAAALGGDADYVITGDHDLHEVAGDPRLGTLRIVTVRQFLEILKDRGLWEGI